MLKVRCFKTTGDHRPFLSKFYVKLGFRHFQRCESTKQPQFNAELVAGDYRFRKSITAGGLQPGVTIRLRYLLQNEYNSRWASGTSSATSRLSNHNVPSGSSANPYSEARSAESPEGIPKEVQLFLLMSYFVLGNVYWTFNLLLKKRLFGTFKMFYCDGTDGTGRTDGRTVNKSVLQFSSYFVGI